MAPLIIKVCGMTEAENIRNVEQLDVDMIGFIFYPKSPRCLCEIPAYLPVRAKRVGVFVNESKETILMYADRFALDYIQLHGCESPGYCRSLRSSGLHLIKAFSISQSKDLATVSDIFLDGLYEIYADILSDVSNPGLSPISKHTTFGFRSSPICLVVFTLQYRTKNGVPTVKLSSSSPAFNVKNKSSAFA